MCERLEEEDSGIINTTCRAGSDPVGILSVEAEVVALVETFESTVDDEVFAFVTTRESDLEVPLTGVDGGGFISDDEVL